MDNTIINDKNSVSVAYRILCKVLHETKDATKEDYAVAIEEAIGYLGEALCD